MERERMTGVCVCVCVCVCMCVCVCVCVFWGGLRKGMRVGYLYI